MTRSARESVLIAQFCMETNTFSDMRTGFEALGPRTYLRGGASTQDPDGLGCSLQVFRSLAEADGFDVVESICAYPEPGGPVIREAYEKLRDALLDDIGGGESFRFVLLNLHGAMVADGYVDCEGDLLRRLRERIGADLAVGVTLDPHCHLTDAMVKHADIIVSMREYPHIDFNERAAELYRLVKAKSEGTIKPVSAVFDCRMVGLFPTTMEPMAGFNRSLATADLTEGVLSTSFIHGFPWGDTPDTGARVLVVADGDARLAEKVAARLGLELYALRDALLPRLPTIGEVIDAVRELDGLVVMADVADNPGGGGPGDRTDLLRAIGATGLPSAFGTLFDPGSVTECMAAGIGARVRLSVGGKLSVGSGAPLLMNAEVKGLADDLRQPIFDSVGSLGPSAWIRWGAVDVVLASVRCQTFSPEVFTTLGIELSDKSIVGIKSMEHFRARFAPIADHVFRVSSPGALSMDFAHLPYVAKRDLNYHPRVADPLA